MGVLIFTHDAQKYREGHFVEGNEVLADPMCSELTVIVHKRKPTAKECLAWLPFVAYRMVWVCETAPKIKNDSVIFDGKFASQRDYTRSIDATIRWKDRKTAHKECAKVPIPLMLSFLKENNKDMCLWRNLATAFTNVPEDFQQALIAFAHKPLRKMNYPKKKKKEKSELPFGVRSSDIHWENILLADSTSANHVRKHFSKTLPKGMKKREQGDGWI